MIDFFRNLFDTTDFMPRWNCGDWSGGHGYLHILSDLAIWSAYYTIPAILIFFILRRKDTPFRKIFWLFGAFILLCGTTHLMDAIIFWWPAYRLAGLIKFLTAVVSWGTVAALVVVAPRVLAMPSPEELEREVLARRAVEAALQKANAQLEAHVADRTRELAEADARWRKFTSSNIVGVGVANERGDWLEANDELLRMLKHTRADLEAGRIRWLDMTPPEFTELDQRAIAAANEQGGCQPYEKEYIVADGTRLPIMLGFTTVEGKRGEFIVFILDMTRLRAAERELHRSQEEFRQLADAIPNLAWMAQPDGHIDWYNSRWFEYTGTTLEQMQGWGWQAVHDPQTLPKVLERWTASLNSGQFFDMVFPLRGADGIFRPFLTRVQPFRGADGHIVRWFGTNTDISEQQQLQEELRQVAARLSEADRRKDEFIATLAHELRNPLAPICTGLEVMKLAADDPATVEKVRATMERQAKQLTALIGDLLDMSRITQGKLKLRKARITLADVVATAVEAVRPAIDEAGHELKIALPEVPIHLDGDATRLAQIISNLLHNAAKYTPKKGRIALTATVTDEHRVRIAVRDNGIGIPAAMLGRIFEMFAQIERPLEHGATGLGIGLTLVKSLVEMHGGTVEVHSDGPDRGSEFAVRLPILVSSSDDTAPTDEKASQVLSNGKRRVLIVDDNQAAAEMLSLAVKMTGYEVRVAHDGVEAIDIAVDFRPHVIFMDLGMPKMNGFETARHLRSQVWGRDITLVALSGWGQEEDRRRTREAGFDHHLVKPAEPAVLQELLAKLGE